MFNIPFIYRGGFDNTGTLPTFGSATPILWVDASKSIYSDYGTTPATINSHVKQWNDQTGYHNNLTATTLNSPIFSATTFSPSGSSSTIPYIEVNDLSAQYMAAPRTTSLQTISSGLTLFIVFKKNPNRTWSSGAPIIEFNSTWSAESEGFGLDGDSSPTTLNFWYRNASVNTTSILVPWGSGGVDANKFFYYTFKLSAGTMTGYVGQTLKTTGSAIGSNKNMQPVASAAKFYVGGGFNGTVFAQSSPIDVAEVILYNGAIPTADLPSIWNYLRQKYGFTS